MPLRKLYKTYSYISCKTICVQFTNKNTLSYTICGNKINYYRKVLSDCICYPVRLIYHLHKYLSIYIIHTFALQSNIYQYLITI